MFLILFAAEEFKGAMAVWQQANATFYGGSDALQSSILPEDLHMKK